MCSENSPMYNEFPDLAHLTISSFHHRLFSTDTQAQAGRGSAQSLTCTALVQAYLDRIARYDSTFRSLIYINPDALSIAAQKDLEARSVYRLRHRHACPASTSTSGTTQQSQDRDLASSSSKSSTNVPPLHGVPFILKDNFTTHDTPTSAGVLALQSLRTATDALVIQRLRSAGAIILAKANMHEFALHGTTTSSLGGQTLNPYDCTRTPGGSSGGTAAALAMGVGIVGCGSDTVNSLRSPASACGIVGFRPSRGRVCMEGIVPVCQAQDVVGPMGRCVADVKAVFYVMKDVEVDADRGCQSRSAAGVLQKRRPVRIGVLESYFELDDPVEDQTEELIQENKLVQHIVREALSSIVATHPQSDIQLVTIHPASHPDWRFTTLQSTADTQIYEFQERLDAFLQSPTVITPYASLQAIAESGLYHAKAVTEVFTAPLKEPSEFCTATPGYRRRLANIAALKQSVTDLFVSNDLDALVYPHQRQLPVGIGETIQPRRNGILAALTGRPAICLPAGYSSPTMSAPQGIPIGLELMGQVERDEELLDLAETIENILPPRKVADLDVNAARNDLGKHSAVVVPRPGR
ncbi:Glutamyl-tRNA(Gln) amidotransferase subunit A [Penicillium ucsense]|uniref:Glutamyl-tRNA(Gln) amidotransferase subunit A n=1 Tax=Penicillium ucsense TaxID=2839758 RepID=A0A8J8WKT3_9EURO|nr:Glutamyl-tRNA(Gln) amidotransferase subunit A [Penicillium ucsense]KAF7734880.1 Glutamyl-tRNA(Gln) amidotransferase subunit A [Penicillium ucsense]